MPTAAPSHAVFRSRHAAAPMFSPAQRCRRYFHRRCRRAVIAAITLTLITLAAIDAAIFIFIF
jgi:hypothetical protein